MDGFLFPAGNGPSALILSYILHGHIPLYDTASPHPDHLLHEKLLGSGHDLLNLDIDALTDHFAASRFSYSTQALPVNVLLDTLVRPLGETDDAQKKTCIKWHHDSSRAVSHVVIGDANRAGGQWVDNPVHANLGIGTLSYAGMISLPGYAFDHHYQRRHGAPMPIYLRPSRREVADYLAAYPDQVGISESFLNGQQVSQVCRRGEGFFIASHNIYCGNLILASGIFSELISPPPLLSPLDNFSDIHSHASSDPLLIIGSGFSAADVILSNPPSRKIIHIYKWAPATSPSPLRACHQQAYPEYAGIYRRMKLAALSSSQAKDKRPKPRHSYSDFDLSRDWSSTYEGLPNAEIVNAELTDDGTGAVVTFRIGSGQPFERKVSSLAYVVGRRGSLKYLSPSLLREVLPVNDSASKSAGGRISGQTLREKANEDLEVAPHVFVIGSLTGDSLIRFAYGGCAYAAGKIMQHSSKAEDISRGQNTTDKANSSNGVGVRVFLRESNNSSRCQTPSPRIPAMNGLDGHEASPMSLLEKYCLSLDRRKESD